MLVGTVKWATQLLLLSQKRAKKTIIFISVLLIVIIDILTFTKLYMKHIARSIRNLAVELPMIYFLIKLFKANDKKSYSKLSHIIKIIMIMNTFNLVFSILLINKMFENLKSKSIVLASKSPRRKALLSSLGIKFKVKNIN